MSTVAGFESVGPDASFIVAIFNRLFRSAWQTELAGGALEPSYQPVTPPGLHRIFFREDFVASALHEVAHWCLAGSARRLQEDYGYWYEPARDLQAQSAFERAEARPQALEWIFCVAAGLTFRVSVDNLALRNHDTRQFRSAVHAEVPLFITRGLPRRAAEFAAALNQSGINFLDHHYYQGMPD